MHKAPVVRVVEHHLWKARIAVPLDVVAERVDLLHAQREHRFPKV